MDRMNRISHFLSFILSILQIHSALDLGAPSGAVPRRWGTPGSPVGITHPVLLRLTASWVQKPGLHATWKGDKTTKSTKDTKG